jgi:hypothetical protein
MVDSSNSDQDGRLQQRVDDLQAQVEDLRQQVADTGQRVRHDLSKASTLPVDTFDTCDPMVEAALADSAVQIFLRHMTAIRPDIESNNHDEAHNMPQPEQISQQEIDECLEAIAGIAAPDDAGTPDPLANLEEERLWILADLSRFGTGLTRHRATKELRVFLTEVWNDDVHIEMLEDLVKALHAHNEQGGASALMQALMMAASNSLERQGRLAEPEESTS